MYHDRTLLCQIHGSLSTHNLLTATEGLGGHGEEKAVVAN